MTTATKAARPRTTHPERNSAQDNGVTAIDAAFARIAEADAALGRIAENAAAGGSKTTPVADDIVTGLIRELTMIVRSDVRLAREMFGDAAADFDRVGSTADDDQESDLCFGDPTAWV